MGKINGDVEGWKGRSWTPRPDPPAGCSGAQPLEARQALGFFEPVCTVLEGGERSLLDPLPPEQREFALKVLARFDVEQNPAAAPPIAIAASPKPSPKKKKNAAE